jgi:hypothetical protein
MKSWAWNIFCALSLLILATSVTLWVSSYSIERQFSWVRQPTPYVASCYIALCERGVMSLRRSHFESDRPLLGARRIEMAIWVGIIAGRQRDRSIAHRAKTSSRHLSKTWHDSSFHLEKRSGRMQRGIFKTGSRVIGALTRRRFERF